MSILDFVSSSFRLSFKRILCITVLLIEVICKLGVGVRGRWYNWWFKFSWDRPVRLHVLFIRSFFAADISLTLWIDPQEVNY